MPSKNAIKEYQAGGVYHIYNRGVDSREIFLDDHDYRMFMHLLKKYLTLSKRQGQTLDAGLTLQRRNYAGKIELYVYCLMPNHFHLMLKQVGEHDISEFMRSIIGNYTVYFNKKYRRSGSLFQGRYKGALMDNEVRCLHLSRYIHLNPVALLESQGRNAVRDLRSYDYSSYQDYLNLRSTAWVKRDFTLSFFKASNPNSKRVLPDYLSYRSYVEDYALDSLSVLGKMSIDS